MKNKAREKRSEVIAVKLTPAERQEVEARARKARIAAGAYVRQRIFIGEAEPEAVMA